jgi:membrane associated rhomboid family serine protease
MQREDWGMSGAFQMIPISADSGPRRSFPFINYALILANVAVFVVEQVKGDCFVAAYSTIPAGIVHDVAYTFQGCPYSQPSPVYLTLLTSMFLHASLLHIAGNMLFLWVFGDNVEDRLGHIPYLLFYLVCGLAASAAQIAISPDSTLLNLGASGAIAGVLGAYLVFFPTAQVRTLIFIGFFVTLIRVFAFIVIGLWFVLQLFDSFVSLNPANVQSGGVAYAAHVGGFITGLVIALLARPLTRRRAPKGTSYPYWPQHPDLHDSGSL